MMVFDRNFDRSKVDKTCPKQKDDCNPKLVTLEALEVEYERGKAEGIPIGRDEALKSNEVALLSVLQEMGVGISQTKNALAEMALEFEVEATKLIQGIVLKLVPMLKDGFAEDFLVSEIGSILRNGHIDGAFTVKTNPVHAKRVKALFEATMKAKTSSEEIEIVADSSVGQGSARVEWRDGYFKVQTDEICDQLLSVVNSVSRKS